ncbi:peptidylprolyl isomerase [Salmonella enterica subsp. enterica serovar Weltevreden]|nr:peptidylprolyl isomerase [Salmonella enterica subsp. enterica serovar Weltevreden]
MMIKRSKQLKTSRLLPRRFYNNTIFHRVINLFYDSGGAFEPGMKQKAVPKRRSKRSQQWSEKYPWYAGNGTYQAPQLSATAQFFINVADNDFLNFSGESLQAGATASLRKS